MPVGCLDCGRTGRHEGTEVRWLGEWSRCLVTSSWVKDCSEVLPLKVGAREGERGWMDKLFC